MSAYPELKPCQTCLTPMRPGRRKASEYPFKTLCAKTATKCGTCHQRALKATKPQQPKVQKPVTKPIAVQESTLRGLSRFLEDRSRRLRAGSVAK